MYNRISYGSFSPYLSPMPDISRKEFNLLIALLLPTVIFGIFPSVIIETLDIPTTTLLYVTETPNFVDVNYTILEIKDYTEQALSYLQETSTLQLSQVDKISNNLEVINIMNIIKNWLDVLSLDIFTDNNIPSTFINLNVNLQEFLSTLTRLELFAFISLCFNSVILNALISILFISYGEFLIKYFNLEIRYPKLAKFIAFRRTLQKYSLRYNLFLIFFCTIPQLFVCLLVF